jgi:hypothetical protein
MVIAESGAGRSDAETWRDEERNERGQREGFFTATLTRALSLQGEGKPGLHDRRNSL